MEWIIEPLSTPGQDSGGSCTMRKVDVCVGPASHIVICNNYKQ